MIDAASSSNRAKTAVDTARVKSVGSLLRVRLGRFVETQSPGRTRGLGRAKRRDRLRIGPSIAQNLGVPSRTTRSPAGSLRVGWAFAFAFAMALGLSAPVQARGDDAVEARRHAQRASGLAASGKCRQAVAEWNKAMAILRDPALLFNRAECYRKLGDADAAVEDYRQFLSDLPKAPNRAEVERRIAELSAQKD